MAFWMLPAAMAGMSMIQQGQQQKQQAKAQQGEMMANAANLEYSPWTGFKGGVMAGKPTGGTMDILGAGAQGAMKGAMFGKQFSPAPTQQPGANLPSYQSPWGGMAQKKPSLYGATNPNEYMLQAQQSPWGMRS